MHTLPRFTRNQDAEKNWSCPVEAPQNFVVKHSYTMHEKMASAATQKIQCTKHTTDTKNKHANALHFWRKQMESQKSRS